MTRMMKACSVFLCAMLTVVFYLASAGEGAEQAGGDLLLVIDMQNAYTAEGPWTCPNMARATEQIIALIESGRFSEVVFTRFDAPQDPVGTWKDYNVINREVNEDEWMNEMVPELAPYLTQYSVFSKSTYSSMTVPEIREAAEQCTARGGSVVLTGVVSECCVLSTAFEAIDLGCPVIYITDACAGCSDDLEAAVVSVLAGLDYVQTTILDTAAYLEKAAAE
ncbi:cysteine hydrolase family protein [Aristaeella hokkaidonensis]|uniref:Cysteine hydrolase n=1 Tax=Aristaeella hokkaidonensis TaxID=3046382 RepID=A0AC61N238_9FIRM|nr:cysteine hydrolase [Aristaeella hokkaidonensis]QUC67604.1 cysteine hydrolase [Aristaeella hokkaidonensis]SNT92649.1 Nicotinamidase-related amidase [Aristaeella hokkaidonensis]